MSPTALPSARPHGGLNGRHVLLGFVAFFGCIFVVNGSMIYSALSTNTGLVANEPYRKGLHYNDRIAAAERQALLDWRESVTLDRDGTVTVRLTAGEDRPVPGLALGAVVGRPATNRQDHAIVLSETAPGVYSGRMASLEPGAWLVSLEARAEKQAPEPVFRARRRLWLTP